jgi:hypothetical protein
MDKAGGVRPHLLPRAILLLAIAVTLYLFLGAGVAAAQTISFVPAEKTVNQSDSTTFDLVLDSVPKGLAGYEVNVSLSSPDKAEIMFVEYPAWASLNKNSSFPADKVTISGVDLGRLVQNGSTDIPLATLTVRGDSPGLTDIIISVKELDADGGSPIQAAATPGRLTVAGSTTAPGMIGSDIQSNFSVILAVVVFAGILALSYYVLRRKKRE